MANPAYHHLYNNKRWRDKRKAQLREHPLCEMCEEAGRATVASIADHVEPHRGDEEKFWSGALQSLCPPCHDGPKKMYEMSGKVCGCSADGMPLDRNHHWK